MMLYRIVIEAQGDDPQALKEDLAMALERARPSRIVEVEPLYTQQEMGRSGREWLRDLYLKQQMMVESRMKTGR